VDDVRAARARLADLAPTPLVRLNADAPAEIFLKLENLQPIGSFKLRGAGNAMRLAGRERLADGVWTASAGNMAQGVAWHARQMSVPCRVVVPDHAPATKLDAIRRLGASITAIPHRDWAEVLRAHHLDGMSGTFIHPVSDPAVIAGNGTIGLEILEACPDVDVVVVPYGGGGLSCGIAVAITALAPRVEVYAAEVTTAAPLAASLAAGEPREVTYTKSFVDGIGAPFVLSEMWPLASTLLAGALTSTPDAIAAAVRLLVERNHVVAEGAGAASVAAAIAGRAGSGRIVCVVSGGNVDAAVLMRILAGEVP
jgi:threonine dehydratase